MKRNIDCFVVDSSESTQQLIHRLQSFSVVDSITILTKEKQGIAYSADIDMLVVDSFSSTSTVKMCCSKVKTNSVLFISASSQIELEQLSLERMIQVAVMTKAAMVYADYFEVKEGVRSAHPVIDYQKGSLRDDFNFGPIQLYSSDVCKMWADQVNESTDWAGFYSLRLFASTVGELIRIPEFLSTMTEQDSRKTGEKQFDYVSNSELVRKRQIEFEIVCSNHLKYIGAYVSNENREKVEFELDQFSVTASVIIPVFNRIKTIRDAVESVLIQKTNFPFNIIVVDNYSTDGTTELLSSFSDERLIIIHPERRDLGIGGCWMEGVDHKKCGAFAVQLDSDDLYSSEATLQKIVDTFHSSKAAMVIGSYQMTDFDLNEIPPGVIDHKEWSDENGTNNALRINGLGAPRAFYTPILREIRIPNVSYGEDYAVGLALTRSYQLGRIYDPVYLCRRWDDNSDASLDIAKENIHNTYKDRVRTFELLQRLQ